MSTFVPDQGYTWLGEASDFDEAHGYHAHGVSCKTPTYAPQAWEGRTVAVRVEDFVGRCMEPHDLVLSKLGAGREKDPEFARAAADLKIINQTTLEERLTLINTTADHSRLIARRIAGLFH